MYVNYSMKQELQLNYRLRRSRTVYCNVGRKRVFIVSGRNGKKATIHEGFEMRDKRKLKRLLRQLGYIN
jgi:hypothetical protein